MPTVSSCCGIKLRTGSLLIGYFEVIISFIGIVLSSLLIWYINEFENTPLYRNVSMIGMTVSLLTFIVGLFLTNGIKKTDRNQVKPWIVIKAIMLCFEILILCFTCWILYIEYTRGTTNIIIYIIVTITEFLVIGKIISIVIVFLIFIYKYFRIYLLYNDSCKILLQSYAKIPGGAIKYLH